MKKIFPVICLMTALQFSPIGDQAVASAHTLPKDELVIGGVGYGGTLGYVKEIYGEPGEIRTIQKKGVKEIIYVYSKDFKISGRSPVDLNLREEDYPVIGFLVATNTMKSDSGIRVGMAYQKLEEQYGTGLKYETEDKEIFYRYDFDEGKTAINYFVNDKGLISKIYMGTDN